MRRQARSDGGEKSGSEDGLGCGSHCRSFEGGAETVVESVFPISDSALPPSSGFVLEEINRT